jgi:hypothetical protein
MLQSTNLIIQGAQLPAAFKGKPNDLFQAMLERMRIVSPFGTSFFVISDTMPTSNQGPWLRGGVAWWVFDPNLKTYVPLDISASETHWYQVGSDTPSTANPPLWLKTAPTTPPSATAAEPTEGTPIAWYLFDGSTWVILPVLIDDRSLTNRKFDPARTAFFGTASGTDNYSLSFDPSTPFGYGNGSTEAFAGYIKFSNANTGASTLSLNGNTATAIKKNVSNDLTAGEIKAGSVHLVIYDGQFFQLLSSLPSTAVIPGPVGGVGPSEGLIITNDSFVPDDILVITADSAIIENTSGGKFQSNAVNVSVDFTVTGLNGLDTGSTTVNTWYFVWLISDGSTTAGIASLSSTGPTMPTGYTYKGLFGAVRTNSTNDLTKIWQTGRKVFLTLAQDDVTQPTVPPSVDFTAPPGMQPISDAVPTIAKTVSGSFRYTVSGVSSSAWVIVAGSDTTFIGAVRVTINETGGTPDDGGYFEVPIITPQQIYVSVSATTADITGYTI